MTIRVRETINANLIGSSFARRFELVKWNFFDSILNPDTTVVSGFSVLNCEGRVRDSFQRPQHR